MLLPVVFDVCMALVVVELVVLLRILWRVVAVDAADVVVGAVDVVVVGVIIVVVTTIVIAIVAIFVVVVLDGVVCECVDVGNIGVAVDITVACRG